MSKIKKESKPNKIKLADIKVKTLGPYRFRTADKAILQSLENGKDYRKAISFAFSAYPVNVALISIGDKKFIYKIKPVNIGKEVECTDDLRIGECIIRTVNLKSVKDFSRETLFSLNIILDTQTLAEIREFFN